MSNDNPLGLIYGADINWSENRVGNAGIFIGDEGNRENRYALEASVLLNDFAFYIGIESIFIKVLSDNHRAIGYNKLLGYQPVPGNSSSLSKYYFLNRVSYAESRAKLSHVILQKEFEIMGEPCTNSHILSRLYKQR